MEEYLKHQGDQVPNTDESGVEDSGADEDEEQEEEGCEEEYEDDEGDFEVEGGGCSEEDIELDREGKMELTEVWPQPKEDEHAFVTAEGGVRRRRTTTAVLSGDASTRRDHTGMPRRYVDVQPITRHKRFDLPSRKRIRFAPLRVPFRRRLQTLSVIWHELALGIFLTMFWFALPNPFFWPLLLPYLLHLLFTSSHANGASPWIRSRFLRALPIWKYYNAYFPITLHRTVALDPTKNYIFGYQPHGIIGIGAWGCFTTDDGVQEMVEGDDGKYASAPGGSFGRLFPGIRNTLLTLEGTFRVPLYREYLLAMGLGSVSKRSCEALLGGKYVDRVSRSTSPAPSNTVDDIGWTVSSVLQYINPFTWWFFFINLFISMLPSFLPSALHPYIPTQPPPPGTKPNNTGSNTSIPSGNAITIVLGGAHESLLTLPHHYRIILRRRRGFLKLALRNPNTHLVPVLAFGENDLYETLVPERGTWLDKLQKGIKRWFGWTVPVFWARGVFNYDVGMIPFRCGVEVVCGRPVVPQRWEEEGAVERWSRGELDAPTEEEVDQLQEKYIEELQCMWDQWKDVFAPDRKGELEIVE